MSNEYHCCTCFFSDFLNLILKVSSGEVIKRPHRFIQKKNFRIIYKRPCYRNSLSHTTTYLMRINLFESAQSNHLYVLRNSVFILFIDVSRFKSGCNVLFNRQPFKETSLLEHISSLRICTFYLFSI